MRLCVVRGPYLNAADAGNYYGAIESGVELTFAHQMSEVREMKMLYPGAGFFHYDYLHEILDQEFDVLDVPDMFYDFSQKLAVRHDRAMHLAWDNMPGRNTGLPELQAAWRHTARSNMALNTLVYDGVDPEWAKIIYGAVDTKLFHPLPYDQRENAVLFASRNVPEKGFIHALWALKGLDVGLRATEYAPLLEQKRVSDSIRVVRWLGQLNRLEMRDALQRAKCLVFPSMPMPSVRADMRWTEQFGQLLIEAMACGTPVAAYASGAIPEVLGAGYPVCTCGDWVELRSFMGGVLSNKKTWIRLSEQGRERAVGIFDQRVIGAQIADWYTP